MANVLLINPDPTPRVLPPLGICYIAENLKKHGHRVRVQDRGFDTSLDLEEIDLVGITATTLTYYDACRVVEEIKAIHPGLPVLIGGIHASILPDFVLEDSGADAVVVGEGEEVMIDLTVGSREVRGILRAPVIDDLDGLPFPTYEYFDLNRYFRYPGADRIRWTLKQPSIAMIGIRGCPFACTFCGSKELFGRKVRYRSPDNIAEEIDFLMSTHGVRSVYFYDDTFTLNKDWILSLCRKLAERRIEWICGTRVDMVDADILWTMKASGCKFISYGIESGSDRMLKDVIKKGITLDQVEEALHSTRKAGIGIIANYMFGLPGETEDDLKATLRAVKSFPADAAELSIFMPLPGAELAEGLDWRKYTSGKNPYHQPSLVHDKTFAELVTAYHRRAVRAFYFSPGYLLRRLSMVFRPKQFFFAFKSLLRLLAEVMRKQRAA